MSPIIVLALALGPTGASVHALAPCHQTRIAFDQTAKDVDGLSHAGVVLTVRNQGPAACSIPGLPHLDFVGVDGAILDIQRQAPRGMHPGPVALPVALATGGEATSALRWVSGDVFDGRHCLTPAKAALMLNGQTQVAPWRYGRLCGPPGGSILIQQPPLRAEPAPGDAHGAPP